MECFVLDISTAVLNTFDDKNCTVPSANTNGAGKVSTTSCSSTANSTGYHTVVFSPSYYLGMKQFKNNLCTMEVFGVGFLINKCVSVGSIYYIRTAPPYSTGYWDEGSLHSFGTAVDCFYFQNSLPTPKITPGYCSPLPGTSLYFRSSIDTSVPIPVSNAAIIKYVIILAYLPITFFLYFL